MTTAKKIAIALLTLAALLTPASSAAASPAPAWGDVSLTSYATNFTANDATASGYPMYALIARNTGGGPTTGPITITDTLPPGLFPGSNPAKDNISSKSTAGTESPCAVAGQTLTCSYSGTVYPGGWIRLNLAVSTGSFADGETVTDTATISGGGAPPATVSTQTTISPAIPAFDFLPGANGFGASATDPDGSASSQAGSHPQQITLHFNFPTAPIAGSTHSVPGIAGTLRELKLDLPAGLVVNPAATPVRCTEAQLENGPCPDASQVGIVDVPEVGAGSISPNPVGLFNVVPPPGVAAEFGFQTANTTFHVAGGVRPGGEPGGYTLTSSTPNALAILPIADAAVELWGSPSDPSHNTSRGQCAQAEGPTACPVTPTAAPFLSMPTSCTGQVTAVVHADQWEDLGDFHDRSATFADVNGNPTAVTGCNRLGFAPTLQARPTTSQGDSPSGLSADLHIPQTNSLESLATAHLRKAVVTLPAGLTLNPSSANGLEACSSAQIGIDPGSGAANANQPACPDAAKIGAVEVDSPLVPDPLVGSVYVAKPFDNPFDSLLAIYVTVEDPATGTLIKLAGHVEPNPDTGQLVTTFDNNPQLPFTDFKLSFFAGPGGVLRTPAVCGTYSTTSQMTPWSAPESGPPTTPSDTYQISGSCSASVSSEPNKPEFEAGTVSPIAGKYTPFVIRLRREDGSQQFSQVTLTPPPGFTGRLAGIPYCSDAALAAAASKSGNEEKASPSCSDASKVGAVHVAAGAGPAPYWTQGTAYLAGPYKGAPLSMAIVTPATAGPYDLGTVVTRVALHVNPVSAQITADADPIPSILEGIPLDVRQVNVSLDRNQFTRTGTSCEPMSVSGTLLSTLGQSAALTNPFQLGNCANLGFKPKLSLRLIGQVRRGGDPALRAQLTMPEGGANIGKAVVALPHSEFLDQAHIKTICTRVQFNEGGGNGERCPPASVYGHARAITPLLDSPLEGPVYLRSSSHNLPDLVAALNGQIDVVLDGRVDSIHGGIRTTFEAVPDQPVSKFVLTMEGGKKGLLENSTNICKGTHSASASFDSQSGVAADLHPALRPKCPAHRAHRRHRAG
jgi:hypothetical protein